MGKKEPGSPKYEVRRERKLVGPNGLDVDWECESAVGWIRILSGTRDIRVRGKNRFGLGIDELRQQRMDGECESAVRWIEA